MLNAIPVFLEQASDRAGVVQWCNVMYGRAAVDWCGKQLNRITDAARRNLISISLRKIASFCCLAVLPEIYRIRFTISDVRRRCRNVQLSNTANLKTTKQNFPHVYTFTDPKCVLYNKRKVNWNTFSCGLATVNTTPVNNIAMEIIHQWGVSCAWKMFLRPPVRQYSDFGNVLTE